MICCVCAGRGWSKRPDRDWPDACKFCEGRGQISWGFVAKRLDEDPATLARVREGRSKVATCVRVLEKVSEAMR